MKNFLKFDINLTTLLIIILFSVLSFVGMKLYTNRIDILKEKLETEVKLKNALIDNVTYYQNKEKEWVAEKLVIQTSIKNLEQMNKQLTVSQKELLDRIKETNKKNDIIAAALIQTQVKIDSLLHKGQTIIDTTGKKITFSDLHKDGNKEVRYSFTVGHVLPAPSDATPTLFIDSLYFPNKQFVQFFWKNDKKNGYPVSFSVSNSNDYFKTVNIDSFTIPKISKEILNPNGWQKIENFFIRSGNSLIYIGIGGIIGAGTAFYLLK